MQKLDAFLNAAREAPIVPVLVVPSVSHAAPLARALVAGGLRIAEVTLRTEAGPAVIAAMKRAEPGLIVGAGTVLTRADVEAAMSAGSDFLVAPGMTAKLLDALGAHASVMIPGVATASEAMARQEEGFGVLKLFPAAVAGGVAALKAMAGPLPLLRFMPTGGVTEANARDYLAVPNVIAAGGSWLATPEDMAAGDWTSIEARCARAARLAVRES